MSETTQFELHGHEKQVFSNFNEDGSYLERVNFPDREAAAEELRGEGFDTQDLNLEEVFMRYGPAETDEQANILSYWADEDSPAWWECDEDHPAAVPFWKDA